MNQVRGCESVASCPCCGRFARTLCDLLRHVRLLHFGTPGFTNLTCNIDGCKKRFRKYTVFRNHIYDYHANKIQQNIESPPIASLPPLTTSPPGFNYPMSEDQIINDGEEELIEPVTKADDMQKAAAIWILKTQEINKLTQSATEKIMEDVGALYEAALSNVEVDVVDALREEGVDQGIINKLHHIFSPSGPHGSLFHGLETHYLQVNYFKQHLKYVVS